MIVLDSSVVLALMDTRDIQHERVREWMEGVPDELCTTPLVLAELDHLVPRKGGSAAAQQGNPEADGDQPQDQHEDRHGCSCRRRRRIGIC